MKLSSALGLLKKVTKNRAVRFTVDGQGFVRERKSGVCPVCYLGRRFRNEYWGDTDYANAAKALGLDLNDASAIVNAADNRDDLNKKPLRPKLLKACGFKRTDR